ncbi:MAG: hypothetical protein AAGK97_13555, partial [Bacteroidota bacterium]
MKTINPKFLFNLILLSFFTFQLSAQNVGIGTETPDDKLEISDAGSTNLRITSTDGSGVGINLNNTGNTDWRIFNGGGSLFFSRGDLDGLIPSRIVFREDGRIGFGDITPDADFEFQAGGATTDFRITASNLVGRPRVDLMSGIEGFASYHWRLGQDNRDFVIQYGRNEFALDSIEAMRIDNATGFAGFGENDPQARIHVAGSGMNATSGGTFFRSGFDGGSYVAIDNNEIAAKNSSDEASTLYLQYWGGNLLVNSENSGRLGVGTLSPQAKVHITDGSDVNLSSGGQLVLGATSAGNLAMDGNEIQARNNGNAGNLALQHEGGNVHMVNGGGRVGIGTTNPLSGVHIHNRDLRMQDDGNINAIFLDHNGSGNGGEIDLYNDAGALMIEIEASETTGQGAEINMRNNAGEATIIFDADFGGNGRVITDEMEIKGGSDLAEHFDVADAKEQVLEPGMLVSIDPENPGKLMLS